MCERCQLVMVPGMATDHRLLEPQRRGLGEFFVPAWLPARRGEGLPQYARRLAETLPPARRLVLGGVSLGGMLAYEMARQLRPAAVVLVASCRSGRAVRPMFCRLRPVLCRLPVWFFRGGQRCGPVVAPLLFGRRPEIQQLLMSMFRNADAELLRWAVGAVLHWQPEPLDGIPVYQIHGENDRLIPAAKAQAREIIPRGGHLINITHADEVNHFIRKVLDTAGAAP
jgi:pimeloyl-ACP methyl ester carboxylesterase